MLMTSKHPGSSESQLKPHKPIKAVTERLVKEVQSHSKTDLPPKDKDYFLSHSTEEEMSKLVTNVSQLQDSESILELFTASIKLCVNYHLSM